MPRITAVVIRPFIPAIQVLQQDDTFVGGGGQGGGRRGPED